MSTTATKCVIQIGVDGAYKSFHPETEVDQVVGLDKELETINKNIAAGASADAVKKSLLQSGMALYSPTHYMRNKKWAGAQKTLTPPSKLEVAINNKFYTLSNASALTISDIDGWDDKNLSVAANRAGKDFYIYACQPTSGTSPDIVLSANSTVPTGKTYTTDNTRKIGGFHCLCADVGTITDHPLSGYVAGDILPATIWDLWHRPKCDSPEGMAYEEYTDTWLDIYGNSWNGTELVSAYNGVWADGTSTKKWHGEASLEQLLRQGKRLPWRHEFQMAAKGSNEQTNIKGSADPNTTGGHIDTKGRRMISNIGLEDCCGALWQWTMHLGFAGGSGWTDSVYSNGVDARSYGQTYGALYRLLVGGFWADGASCGSRAADCHNSSVSVDARYGCRGASEPLHRKSESSYTLF